MSTISRPASSLSQYRPGTGYEGVLPNTDDITNRPDSRQSIHSNSNDDDDSMMCRPGSRLSVRSNTSHGQSRPDSRSSIQSCKQPICRDRPLSRTSVQSTGFDKPVSRTRTKSCDEINQTRPTSKMSNHNRPLSRTSVRSVKSNCSLLSKHKTSSSPACPTKLVAVSNGCAYNARMCWLRVRRACDHVGSHDGLRDRNGWVSTYRGPRGRSVATGPIGGSESSLV